MTIDKGWKKANQISFRKARQIESLELLFGVRLFAFLVDCFLLRLLLLPVVTSIVLFDFVWLEGLPLRSAPFYLLMMLCCWLYFSLMEASRYRATLGKMFCRLCVHTCDGSRLPLRKALLRTFFKFISIFTLVGIVFLDLSKEKQGLHDLICGTIVRRLR